MNTLQKEIAVNLAILFAYQAFILVFLYCTSKPQDYLAGVANMIFAGLVMATHVIALVAMALFYKYKGDKEKMKLCFISAAVVAIVGSTSCVALTNLIW